MNEYFGNLQDPGDGESPVRQGQVAALIWRHRLRMGQAWIEYLLEFLNVVVGYDYRLGQGRGEDDPYRCPTRIGLRRFVFYDGTQAAHPDDQEALRRLEADLLASANGRGDTSLKLARQLLGSLTALEKDRSWYAKTLFPVHENLLMFEAVRPGATLRIARSDLDTSETLRSKSAEDLDKGIEYTARNFFCRGGEVYYLCLSLAADRNPDRGQRVMAQLRTLLQHRNTEIGQLAALIDTAWARNLNEHGEPTLQEFRLGFIAKQGAEGLYDRMLEDVDTLLRAHLDPLETLSLLAHLICFHIILYIYFHTERVLSGNGQGALPKLLVDCSSGTAKGMRSKSSEMLRQRGMQQEQAVKQYVRDRVAAKFGRTRIDADQAEDLADTLLDDLGLRPSKRKREEINTRVRAFAIDFERRSMDRERFIERVSTAITDSLLVDFRKNFKGIHLKLSRAIGFVMPRSAGSYPRYVIGDDLLRTLTLANYRPGQTFSEFVDQLYVRYGLLISYEQVSASGLARRIKLDKEAYRKNEDALIHRMKQTGLVIEYSDSTAMISGVWNNG